MAEDTAPITADSSRTERSTWRRLAPMARTDLVFRDPGEKVHGWHCPLLDAQGVPRLNGQPISFDQLLSYGRFQKLDPQDGQLAA